MDKQQLEAIRARDAADYAAADVLRNIRSAGNTDPELEATINMIADRRDLLALVDEKDNEITALRELLRDAQNYAIDASDRPGATNAYKQAAKDCWERIDAALESKS